MSRPSVRWVRAAGAAFGLLLVALAPVPAAAVEVQKVSGGGVEGWLVEEHQTPVITVRIAFRGGASTDPAGKAGRAAMAAALLTEGAGERDAQSFQRRLQELAVNLDADAGMDIVSISMQTLTRNRDAAFALLRDVLTQPRFDAAAIERVRRQMLARLRQRSEEPGARASDALMAHMFGDHPYGRPEEGTESGVAAISEPDLRTFVEERFARDAILIGVVGDITAEALSELLASTFADLPAAATPTGVPPVTPMASDALTVVDVAVPQSTIAFAQPGLTRDDPDWYAATVLNRILGGGSFTSRLYEEVRESRGLAYSVYSRLSPMLHAGLLRGLAATNNDRVGETVAVIRETWKNLAAAGVSEDEVADAKTFLTGSFPLRFTSSRGIADMLVGMQLYDLGDDYIDRYPDIIRAVTADDVNRVARSLIRPDALSIVVAGQPRGLSPSN